ncbi:carboxymuconolactone decarboxylase family protein [Fictibacillus terranigra]|uniref:Carboxymuconolactone decarboxylase family protein n=1 Tax=Fictibacillus terranigra TaxID=3058424 RepID=A0ABT8E552_9BACL|nr:carboxymuconolactone decarboxylase family protein [Fictibacillus sp. CENA-BCM004]MDN4073042.1 carboxymuconolactone decarboxylase family protein [Fictibacillus sp. CENA-BCM004]MDN4075269.1 carboxymuconolactone decarboxylase family protein [Fictibacillus sp. CENA-BCM004]
MMANNLYQRENLRHLAKLGELAPAQQQAYENFSRTVMQEGVLTKKDKEIIAVAVAHATECPYCIDVHTRNAKKSGASLEELVEAVFVTAALEAGGAVTHSTHMQNALDQDANDTLYRRSNLKKLANLNQLIPNGFRAYSRFNTEATKEGKLNAKLKELIAVSIAHTTECPYCIDVHTKSAQRAGSTKEELSEAILVAAALLAGGAYAHMANLIESYGE